MPTRFLSPLLVVVVSLVGCESPEPDTGKDTSVEVVVPDEDGDGYTYSEGDCDEAEGDVHPGAAELCNGRDDDCDEAVDEAATDATAWYGDGDGDGYGAAAVWVLACEAPNAAFVADAGDCDDGDAAAYPGAPEACTDTVDYDCDGAASFVDADGDGVAACEDCDDADATAFPGAVEACDGVDDDCDGAIDEDAPDAPTWYADADADGFGADAETTVACEAPAASAAVGGDCDDADAAAYPGAVETCDVPFDVNCDGSVGGDDVDGDGVPACDDCDDADATAFPGAVEACDGDDEDCDGEIDEAGALGEGTWYADADGDTYGDAASTLIACNGVAGFVGDATDCDDADAALSPAGAEVCDGIDNDCDGAVDDADGDLDVATATTWYIDYDADGYGISGTFDVAMCEVPAGYVGDATDCDDADAAVNPAGAEVCDAADADEDCDGDVDDADPSVAGQTTHALDADGDGYGEASATLTTCDLPAGYADNTADCDDADAGVSPGAVEVCDAADVDEDCSGAADDADYATSGESTFYYDEDGDGFGDPAIGVSRCDATALWIADATDCDDDDADDHLGAAETIANGDDEDCDGGEICYEDADGDGYRSESEGTVVSTDADCSGAGEALATMTSGDCDDGDATISPAGVEACNAVDDDCDGAIDDDVGGTYYIDADGDGYGSADATTIACSLPSGYTTTAEDCDDSSADASPAGTEVCADGLDNDCDADFADCNFDGDYAAVSHDLRLTTVNSSDYLSRGLELGDLDGDGSADLLGGMPGYDRPTLTSGGVAVWYGPITASGTVQATASAVLTGSVTMNLYTGFSVAAADHDGDGADEIVVGAYGASSYAGAAYILYGGSRRSGSAMLPIISGVATLTGGTSLDYLGYSAAGGGDMDGDGTEEIVVGAYLQDGAATSAGAAYLLYGSATRRSGTIASTAADATIRGVSASAYLGQAVTFVDDMDGDGLDELLVGSYGTSSSTGSAYLFLGDATHLSGTTGASTADATYRGTAPSDFAGAGVYGVGDIDDDGYGDAGVHGHGYDNTASLVGALWVYSGGLTLSTAAHATLYGAATGDYFGGDAMSVGDQDGDGATDLLVGAYLEDTAVNSAGAAYLFYGPLEGSISAASADATFYGSPAGDGHFGRSLPSRPGDITGDGLTDLVIGSYWDDTSGFDSGAVYVWEGIGGD